MPATSRWHKSLIDSLLTYVDDSGRTNKFRKEKIPPDGHCLFRSIAKQRAQNTAVGNAANQYKIGRYVDLTNAGGQNIYGNTNTLMTGNQLNTEFRPYYTTSGNYMFWHDYTVIKLNYLFESLNKIGLVKRIDAQLRLWVNTGTVRVGVGAPDNATNTACNLVPADNTFSNTCPLMVNYLPGLIPRC